MVYGKSFNSRCEIYVNGRVKSDDLRVQAKHTELVLQHFFNRFYEEYMLALLERHSLQTKKNSNNQAKLRIGEIVIIKGDKPRLLWRKGKINRFLETEMVKFVRRIGYISAKNKENLYDKQTSTTFSFILKIMGSSQKRSNF